MAYKIGIFGTAIPEIPENIEKAKLLGKALGEKQCIILTGACPVLPYYTAYEAYQKGCCVWGFSPSYSFEEQQQSAQDTDHSIYEKMIYVPQEHTQNYDIWARRAYRNLSATHASDAGIIIGGRWGTLNEFTDLIQMGKVIGIFTGTGGTADEIKGLMNRIHKPIKAKTLFSDNPKELVEKIFEELFLAECKMKKSK